MAKKVCKKCKKFVANKKTGFCPYCFEALKPWEKLIATGEILNQKKLGDY